MFPLPSLTLLWANRNKIIAGLVLLALIGAGIAIKVLAHKLADSEAALTIETKRADDAETKLADFQKNAQRTFEEITKLNADQAARLTAAKQRERELRNVPKDQDGGVAPVLRDSLARLRVGSGNI